MGEDDVTVIGGVDANTPLDMLAAGSKLYPCYRCQTPIYMAPSSQRAIATQGYLPICLACLGAIKDLQVADDLLPGATEELAQFLAKRRSN